MTTFDPTQPPAPSEPKCYECGDTGIMEVYFLKTLNNPARLYVTAKSRELCAYCNPHA